MQPSNDLHLISPELNGSQVPGVQELKDSLAYLVYVAELQRLQQLQQQNGASSNIFVNMVVGDLSHKKKRKRKHGSLDAKDSRRRSGNSRMELAKLTDKLDHTLTHNYNRYGKENGGKLEGKHHGLHFETLAKSLAASLTGKPDTDRPSGNAPYGRNDEARETITENSIKTLLDQVFVIDLRKSYAT
jgi:hypothetical protein